MSDLTIGTDQAFIGNPLKAMRFKRKKQFINEAKTKDGTKVVQEKGFLELFDEFNKNNLEEMSSENVSLDSFEINNYKMEDEEEEEKQKPEWELPLLDEEKYILGSDDEDGDNLNKEEQLGQDGNDNFFEQKKPLPKQEPLMPQQQFQQSPILPMRKYKTFQAKPGQKLIPTSQGKINFQQKQSVRPFNQMGFQKGKIFQKPFMGNKVKRFRVSNKKLARMGTAPVQTRPMPP